MELRNLGPDVDWPDTEAAVGVRDRVADRPELGRVGPLAEWVAGVLPHRAAPDAPAGFARIRALVVGPSPDELVADAAADLSVGIRAVPVDDVTVENVPGEDVPVENELHGADEAERIGAQIARGAALADEEIDSGADLLIVAVPGMRADAAVAVSVLTDAEPVKVIARGSAATDPERWMALAVEVRDARRRCMAYRDDLDRVLATIDGSRLAVAAAIMLHAAARRTPVLIDGPVAAAAALIAYEAQPRAVRWWASADLGTEPMHELALSRLGLRAILGLGTGLGDGLAGVLAVPVVRAAARV